MAVRTDFTAGEVLAAADLNDTFGAKLNLAGGKVLQVVQGTTATSVTSTSTTLVDTTLTATITPSSVTSKILVSFHQNGSVIDSVSAGNGIILYLYRASTAILKAATRVGYNGVTQQATPGTISGAYLDSPATTSAVTYKTMFSNRVAATSAIIQYDTTVSTITLMEVSA